MAYFPEYKKYVLNIGFGSNLKRSLEWRVSLGVAAFVTLHFIFTLLVSASLLIFVGEAQEHDITKYWADLLGIISLILASVQYFTKKFFFFILK